MKKTILLFSFASICLSIQAQHCINNSNSIKFDGTSTGIDMGGSAVLAPDSAITVEAWIKVSAFAASSFQNSIVSKDGWSVGEGGFVLRCGGNGILSFNIAGKSFAGTSQSWKEALSTTAAIPLNTWTHVAGTFDGTTLKCFVNGVQVGSLPYSGTIDGNTQYHTEIGRLADTQQGQGRYFNGYIDEVHIWERALPASEILANKNDHINPAGQNRLVGYWRFNEGSGTSVSDLSAGNNAGVIANGVWSASVPFNGTVIPNIISGSNSVSPNSSENYAVNPHGTNTYSWLVTNGIIIGDCKLLEW